MQPKAAIFLSWALTELADCCLKQLSQPVSTLAICYKAIAQIGGKNPIVVSIYHVLFRFSEWFWCIQTKFFKEEKKAEALLRICSTCTLVLMGTVGSRIACELHHHKVLLHIPNTSSPQKALNHLCSRGVWFWELG